mgnify:CR=1 FL=1
MKKLLALVLALVFAYLFLVALYESWAIPLAVLLSAAEQIPSSAQRARLIQTFSCDGILRLFRQGKLKEQGIVLN